MKSQSKFKTELTIEESANLIELGVDANKASEIEYRPKKSGYGRNKYLVYSLADLLSILPKMIESFHLNIDAIKEGYNVGYILWDEDADAVRDSLNSYFAPELIDSLYQLLIWCLEQGHCKCGKGGGR